ncbi:hypothetical protein AAY473_037112 [Plecturocebus cupreus]
MHLYSQLLRRLRENYLNLRVGVLFSGQVECSGVISAHCSLHLLRARDTMMNKTARSSPYRRLWSSENTGYSKCVE